MLMMRLFSHGELFLVLIDQHLKKLPSRMCIRVTFDGQMQNRPDIITINYPVAQSRKIYFFGQTLHLRQAEINDIADSAMQNSFQFNL